MGQYRDACDALQVSEFAVSKADMIELHSHYFSKLPLKQFMINLQSLENPKLKAMITRLGTGTSHITMISTAYMMMPRCPIWTLVFSSEWKGFITALKALDDDPLILHPYSQSSPHTTDPYRATGMPALVKVAHIMMGYMGEYTWANYRNVTHVVNIGGVPVRIVEAYIRDYVAAFEIAKEKVVVDGDFVNTSLELGEALKSVMRPHV
jgi:hypothetical protein